MNDIITYIAIPLLFIGMPLLTGRVMAWSMQGDE